MKQFIFLVLLTTLILAANISAQEQRAGKFELAIPEILHRKQM